MHSSFAAVVVVLSRHPAALWTLGRLPPCAAKYPTFDSSNDSPSLQGPLTASPTHSPLDYPSCVWHIFEFQLGFGIAGLGFGLQRSCIFHHPSAFGSLHHLLSALDCDTLNV